MTKGIKQGFYLKVTTIQSSNYSPVTKKKYNGLVRSPITYRLKRKTHTTKIKTHIWFGADKKVKHIHIFVNLDKKKQKTVNKRTKYIQNCIKIAKVSKPQNNEMFSDIKQVEPLE